MKKSSFVAMILGTIGGILFALGMCMCLLPEWNAFNTGLILGCIGLVILLAMIVIYRKMEHKTPIVCSKKTILAIVLAIIGSIGLGVGMCLVIVWNHLISGITIGIIGIVLLLSIIPLVKGLK